jgi:hypothetical protein
MPTPTMGLPCPCCRGTGHVRNVLRSLDDTEVQALFDLDGVVWMRRPDIVIDEGPPPDTEP